MENESPGYVCFTTVIFIAEEKLTFCLLSSGKQVTSFIAQQIYSEDAIQSTESIPEYS